MAGTPLINRTLACLKDLYVVKSADNTNGGVGAANAIVVGALANGSKNRIEVEFEENKAGIITLLEAHLRLKVSSILHDPGSAVKFYVERLSNDFKEGKYSDIGGKGADNAEVWPGQDVDVTHRVLYEGTPEVGDVLDIIITQLVKDCWDDDEPIRLRLIAADGAGGYDEDNTHRYIEFYSTEKGNEKSGYRPRIEIVGDPRVAPSRPTNLSPTTTNRSQIGEGPTRVDRTFPVTATFSSPDSGDYLKASQVEVYPRTATDNDAGDVTGGLPVQNWTNDVIKTYPRGAIAIIQWITAPASAVGSQYKFRLRVQGRSGRWSSWTRLADGWIIPNTKPSAPTGLTVDSGSGTPDYSGRHVDRDKGSVLSGVETQVVVESLGGVEMIMNTTSFQPGDPSSGPYTTITGSGMQEINGGNVWHISHDGRAMAPGEKPKRRHRTVDQYGAVGDWSGWQTWTVGEVPVPTVIPSASAKADSLTPALGASFPSPFKTLLVEAYRQNAVVLADRLWQSGSRPVSPAARSKTVLYGSVNASRHLTWSQVIWVRVRVQIAATNDWSPWSELQPVQINSLPLAPEVIILEAIEGANGVWYVPSKVPRLVGPFADPDLPGDSPTSQVAQLFTFPPGTNPIWDATKTSAIEDYADVPASAGVIYEKAYLAKLRYADTSHQFGPFGFFRFTTHRPPTVSTGTAPAATNPRPRIRWSVVFYGGATQKGYQVLIWDVTTGERENVLDTGLVLDSAATYYDVDAYVLEDEHDYEAQVYITDTFNITALLNGQTHVTSALAVEPLATHALVASVATMQPSGNLPADTFTRTVSPGWGTSSSGHTYDLLGPAADFAVAATEGTISVEAGAERKAHFASVVLLDPTVTVKAKTGTIIDEGSAAFSVHLRCQSRVDHYRAILWLNEDQTVDLAIDRVMSGVATPLSRERTALAHAAGTFLSLKFAADGNTLSAKAWESSDSEPMDWDIEVEDSVVALAGPGSVGVGAQVQASVSNGPVTFTFDSLATS